MKTKFNFCPLIRGHLCKATQLDKVFGPAWLAYGHSFALENEHDQAMAAYFKASQLMEGWENGSLIDLEVKTNYFHWQRCHLPLLYVGVEYGLTNNVKLAEKFFSQALDIAPKDPFVLHEMGVACFQNQEWVHQTDQYFGNDQSKMLYLIATPLQRSTSYPPKNRWSSLMQHLVL